MALPELDWTSWASEAFTSDWMLLLKAAAWGESLEAATRLAVSIGDDDTTDDDDNDDDKSEVEEEDSAKEVPSVVIGKELVTVFPG